MLKWKESMKQITTPCNQSANVCVSVTEKWAPASMVQKEVIIYDPRKFMPPSSTYVHTTNVPFWVTWYELT